MPTARLVTAWVIAMGQGKRLANDAQVPAAVSGSGVTAGSNVAGSLRTLSSDHDGAEVASQAPITLPNTSAETDESTLGTQHQGDADRASHLSS